MADERTMTPKEFEHITTLFPAIVEALEEEGFSKAQIAVTMLGWGARMAYENLSQDRALAAVAGAYDSVAAGPQEH